MAPDDQDRAESLDDDEFAGDSGDYPPEQPYGVEEYGVTGAEQRWPEPLEERLRREQPDRVRPVENGFDLVNDDRGMLADDEAGDVADAVMYDSVGSLAADDGATGDPTTRDVATEHEAPMPAEEAAIHLIEEP
ncbi:MAG: hypothetical protein JWN46_741 [Acidimicrobiales bacterium]|nr:hypothetical protein [Acidimicrobiales bacterium]